MTPVAAVDERTDDRGAVGALDRTGEQVEALEHRGRVAALEQHRPGGAAELAHGGGGLEPVADAVADDQGPAVVVELDEVVPVAARPTGCRPRGDVAGGDGAGVGDRGDHRRLEGLVDRPVLAELTVAAHGVVEGRSRVWWRRRRGRGGSRR